MSAGPPDHDTPALPPTDDTVGARDGDGRALDRDGDRAALDRLLGVPEMAWLVTRVRGRTIAAGGAPLSGVVRLADPSEEQRAAAVRLVGRPRRAGSGLRVDLALVEEILRRGPWPAGLADAVATLGGPVLDHRAAREREAAAWDLARDGLTPALTRFPQLLPWWEVWCAAGGLKRVAGAEATRLSRARTPALGAELVGQVTTVLEALPASGEPLAVLARQTVGDAHGLDATRPLGRLTTAVVQAAFGPAPTGADSGGTTVTQGTAGTTGGGWSTRDTWASAGVVMSNVASTVLCLGVSGTDRVRGADGVGGTDRVSDAGGVAGAGTGDLDEPRGREHAARTATALSLEAMRAARMPLLLTLDQVRSGGVRPSPPDRRVHVCENPTIIEVVAARWAQQGAATAEGAAPRAAEVGPVLVCTSGQPSTAVVELLQVLTAAGARVHYHGDFDWPGLRIARSLGAHVDWEPWRYGAADNRAAVERGELSRALSGPPAPSPWDPRLAAVMSDHGLAVEEEAVADLLATDLLEG